MTLADLPVGRAGVLHEVTAAAADLALLAGMGFSVGATLIRLRSAPFGGPVQVAVGHATFALDRRLAAQLLVVPSAEDEGDP